ncbi:hypothetical protein NB709_004113 [Xanthomonas sacchari]|nr:hypothetical protein [Xanthomonas sacchari]
MGLSGHRAHMCDEVAVGKRWRQLGGVPLQHRLDLGNDYFQGDVVADQMVGQERQPPLLDMRIAGDVGCEQRSALQIQALGGGIGMCEQFLQGQEPQFVLRQWCAALHELHGLGQVAPVDGGAQDVVAINDDLQRVQKRIQLWTRLEAEHGTQQVGIARRVEHVVEEDAFLQRGKRVDVLYVAHAVGNLAHQAIDRLLLQRYQRQHRGCDRY